MVCCGSALLRAQQNDEAIVTIIFDPVPTPFPYFDLRESVSSGITAAGINAALDFIIQANKPWTYYTGVAAGAGALATGIPGAQATLYIVGQTLDFYIFKSPEGSSIDLFLDGVAYTNFNTFAANEVWELVQVTFADGAQRRMDFVNAGPGAGNVSGTSWMALGGPFTLAGSNPYVQQRTTSNMALVNIISFSVRDSDGDSASIPIYVDTGMTIAEYQAFVTFFAPLLDSVLGSQIDSSTLTLNMTLPGGLKTEPVANIENQKGGNLSFMAANSRYKHSTRLPGLLPANFSGKSVLTTGDMDTLIQGIIAGDATVIPRDRQGNDLTALASAVKTFRRR